MNQAQLLQAILAGKATPEQLAEFGQAVARQKIAQAKNSAKQGARQTFRRQCMENFCQEKGFVMPEYPAELQ